ncbi:MAG: aromatic amino acid hydroxylase [Bacteroidetes bacterium]|nr:aromatic amino acid hydroxylase [Bacteroidota bacterium]MDA0879219.1 aromatic amino acid hydroxylase [Bacteroidota bacterium]MDA1114828.1 aromatic amino acid hydroxylase [Bacteroidota bacterium]
MQDQIISNPVLDRLPKHLLQFVKPQVYEDYSPIDHAVWRYVMMKNIAILPKLAHSSYLKGLEQTGISLDKIPNMYGMNRILKDIGWAAVAVDGFIPPQAFMAFQAYNVLVIASDIRQLEHIEYTPAPDIIHEAAGHAPIIANPDYAEYLRRFGEIGSKAISSSVDMEMYEAARKLSILKEARVQDEKAIAEVEQEIDRLQSSTEPLSEMALIRNLHWWTVEYGLVGPLDHPKIYGAGLLSSIGESQACMSPKVKKLPYDIEAAYQSFDITKAQPQLYVTPNFAHLSEVLEEFANKMALRKGGLSGVEKAINSQQLATVELSTGLQISGIFTKVISDDGQPIYIQTTGGTALANKNKTLIGHETEQHAEGFGSPIGKLKGINLAIEDMSPRDLKHHNIYEDERVCLEFEGGVTVTGDIVTGTRNLKGKILIIKFKNCLVTYKDQVLFQPDWGVYDMAVGKSVTSVYSGPADHNSFDLTQMVSETKTIHIPKTSEELELDDLYASVDQLRSSWDCAHAEQILKTLKAEHPKDWLLSFELLQVARQNNESSLVEDVKSHLSDLKQRRSEIAHLLGN